MATEWANMRGRTAGGIRFDIREGSPTGEATDNTLVWHEEYVIRAIDIQAFVEESFPPPQFVDFFIIHPQKRTAPDTALITKTVKWRPLKMLPMDIFNADDGAPDGTYSDLAVVSIDYGTSDDTPSIDEDPNDPETFLTHSISVGGEFLPFDGLPTFWTTVFPTIVGFLESNTDIGNIPATRAVPTIEHNLRWKEVLDPPWSAIRAAMGKVNANELTNLFFTALRIL